MLQLRATDHFFIDRDLMGFADKLTEDGVVPRRIDLLLLAFSYAVAEKLPPSQDVKRHEFVRAQILTDDQVLAVSAAAQWYARSSGLDLPEDERHLMNFVCSAADAGLRVLKERWEGRTKSQLQLDIFRTVEDRLPGNHGPTD